MHADPDAAAVLAEDAVTRRRQAVDAGDGPAADDTGRLDAGAHDADAVHRRLTVDSGAAAVRAAVDADPMGAAVEAGHRRLRARRVDPVVAAGCLEPPPAARGPDAEVSAGEDA